MKTANEVRSKVMATAWGWFRQVGGTFAAALKFAWGHVKASLRPRLPITYLKSPIVSPTSRKLACGPYSRTRDYAAGRQIARFGY